MLTRYSNPIQSPTSGAASPDPASKANKEPEYETIQLTIEYEIRNPQDGIHVVKPSDLYPSVSHLERV